MHMSGVEQVLGQHTAGDGFRLRITAQLCTANVKVTLLRGSQQSTVSATVQKQGGMYNVFLWLEPVASCRSAVVRRLPTTQAHLNPRCLRVQLHVIDQSLSSLCAMCINAQGFQCCSCHGL